MEFVFEDRILNCQDENILLDEFQRMYNEHKYVQCVLYIEKKLSAFSSRFYDVMIIYLYSLIKAKNKEKALKIVKEELSMPYIPALYEDRFKEIYNELKLNYPINSEAVVLQGGGSSLLGDVFKEKIQGLFIDDDLFANAKGYKMLLK